MEHYRHYRYYVEHVPLFDTSTEEPTERIIPSFGPTFIPSFNPSAIPTFSPSFGPSFGPTERIMPSFSPSFSPSFGPSAVPYQPIQFAEPWQTTVVLSVITSTITTIVLICAGTYCLKVRGYLKLQYLRSIAPSVSTVSSLSEEESGVGFAFSDVYADNSRA